MQVSFTVEQIAGLIQGEVKGNPQHQISNLSGIESAGKEDITFISNPKYEHFLKDSQAGAIVVRKDIDIPSGINANLILVTDPYLAFTQLLKTYEKLVRPEKSGIEQPHFIGEQSSYGSNIYLGAFTYIGKHVKIGNNVKIHPQVHIGDHCTIGDNTVIYPGVKIYDQVEIGKNCCIQAGAVIGSDGFGFAPQGDGSYTNIPQLGKVILEDHVDIGANTVIDRATMQATIIGHGSKLDNLIQIAHNVKIGKNVVIAAQTGISGSSTIGDQSILAGQVGVVGHIKIAPKTTVAAQSGIGKSIETEGSVWMGSPAFEKGEYMKSYVVFRKLPQVWASLNELQKKS